VTDKARPIERIRAEVEQVRMAHRFERTGAVSGRLPYCSGVDSHLCNGRVPCPTLCLAEDKLKLAEALDKLHRSVDTVRGDLDAQFPALAKAWIRAGSTLEEVSR